MKVLSHIIFPTKKKKLIALVGHQTTKLWPEQTEPAALNSRAT